MIRLFVAVPLPEEIQDRVAELCSGLPNARWVDPDNFHITLRFIGEVHESKFDDIDLALSVVRAPSFRLKLGGVDSFVVSIGFGVDAFHGVCHAHVLENIAAIEPDGG